MSVHLVADSGREIEVTREVTLGREGTDVLIDDNEASRRHAAVAPEGDGAVIRDLGSRNGTYVNGRLVEGEVALRDGDTIQIASAAWRVAIPAAAPAPAPAAQQNVPAAQQAAPATPAFADASRDGRRVGSAARRIEAAVVSYAVVGATAVAVVAYLVLR